MAFIATERDWDAAREQRREEDAKKEMQRLSEMIEAAERDGDYELAKRRSCRLVEMQDGWY
jgi:hypothetical protein